MARTPSTENIYTGDGSTVVYQFHFPYLNATDVFVSVDTVNVSYTLLPGSTAQVQLAAAPAAGSTVRVYRDTLAITPQHLFDAGVPFLPRYVDENNRQLLYTSQEAINDTAILSAHALEVAEDALALAGEVGDRLDAAILETAEQLREDLLNPTKGGALVARSPLIVESVADLRALPAVPNTYFFTKSYYGDGRGGQGAYRADPADTTSADNGGTVLVTSTGLRVKLLYDGRTTLRQWGCKGNDMPADAEVNADRMQVAIDSAVPMLMEDGVFNIKLSRTIQLEWPNPLACAFFIKSRMRWWGNAGGMSVIKLRDNESTDANPVFYNLFATNQVVTGLYMEGITFDGNGANNLISPGRNSGAYSAFNCATFFASGSVASGGVDASINNSKFVRCEFLNTPGVTQVGLGARFTHPGVKGEAVEFASCRFYNNGNDSHDHSSIYSFGNNVHIHDCDFEFPTPSTGHRSPVCAFELFGSHVRAYNNRVKNYMQGAWVGQGEEGQHQHVRVQNNNFEVTFRGVDFWAVTPQDDGVADVLISDNDIVILDVVLGTPGLEKLGVNIAPVAGSGTRIKVSRNNVRCLDRTNNIGIVLFPTSTHQLYDIDIDGNYISGFSRGIVGSGEGQLLSVSISGNDIEDCAPTTTRSETIGIELGGDNPFGSVSVRGNRVSSGDLGFTPRVGLALGGNWYSLYVDGNDVVGTVEDIQDAAVVSGRRAGRQATTFASLPNQSTWKVGDVVTSKTKPLGGAAGSYYTLDGWTRITAGNSNVLGSDWVERRLPIGS